MKKQEKAIAIAKDVLKRLKLEKLSLARRTGFIVPKGKFPTTGSLQEQIDKAEANCQVCALGGMFLSHVRLHNGIQCDNVCDGSFNFRQISLELKQIFSLKTLALIEGVFEGKLLRIADVLSIRSINVGDVNDMQKRIKDYHNAIVEKARKGKKLLSAKAKTRALMTEICRNIIRNSGEFVLPSA